MRKTSTIIVLVLSAVLCGITLLSCKKDLTLAGDKTDFIVQNDDPATGGDDNNGSNYTVYTGYITTSNGTQKIIEFHIDDNDSILAVYLGGNLLVNAPYKTGLFDDFNRAIQAFLQIAEDFDCVKLIQTYPTAAGVINGNPEPRWIIFYDNPDENGDCWYETD